MKVKGVLKFYFYADEYAKLIDGKLMHFALSSNTCGAQECAEKLIKLIDDKDKLTRLWEYLDGVLADFALRERRVLKFYSGYRVGVRQLSESEMREIKRCVTKFLRRAHRLSAFERERAVAAKYRCAVAPTVYSSPTYGL